MARVVAVEDALDDLKARVEVAVAKEAVVEVAAIVEAMTVTSCIQMGTTHGPSALKTNTAKIFAP